LRSQYYAYTVKKIPSFYGTRRLITVCSQEPATVPSPELKGTLTLGKKNLWDKPYSHHVNLYTKVLNEHRCRGFNTPAFYSGGPEFILRPGDWLSLQIFMVYVSPSRKIRGSILNFPFHILCNSSFTYHPLIRCYIFWVTEKASLNKL
jgi:hypothetical protein